MYHILKNEQEKNEIETFQVLFLRDNIIGQK